MITFAVLNESDVLTASDVSAMVDLCQVQMDVQVAPFWDRMPPKMRVIEDIQNAQPDEMVFVFHDKPDEPGAGGYHTEELDGTYSAKIFTDPYLKNGGGILDLGTAGVSLLSCLSHEAIEAFADPVCNLWADGPTLLEGSCYAYEAADPVQGCSYPLALPDGTKGWVSDFVGPRWFDLQCPADSRLTWMDSVKDPFHLAPGGYVIIRRVPGTEKEIFAAEPPAPWVMETKAMRGQHSRTHRRKLVGARWKSPA